MSMLPFLLFLGLVLIAETDTDDTETDTAPDTAGGDTDGETGGDAGGETVPIPVGDGADLIGTDGADLFETDPAADTEGAADTLAGVSIAAGDGDDTINLTDPSGADPSQDFIYQGASIDGGAGNDTITATLSGGSVAGGDGDDVITVNIGDSTVVDGGPGNDTLGGQQAATDAITLLGGDGNDTIDASNMENVSAQGGAGDDIILISGANDTGAGYVSAADGGAGDDTIRFSGVAIQTQAFEAQTALGGDGADTFELNFSEGPVPYEGDLVSNEDGSLTMPVINIGDFEPGIDTLVLDPDVTNPDNYTITEGSLDENAETGVTTLTIRYQGDGSVDRNLVIELTATGVTWDDISFVDNAPETLFVNGVALDAAT